MAAPSSSEILLASQHSLSNEQRDTILAQIDRDGFAVLPLTLPPGDISLLATATSKHAGIVRASRTSGAQSVKVSNIVDVDPIFLELAMYPPALQLAHDAFGCGAFHINQSNFIARPREPEGFSRLDFLSGSPWHADGPRPAATGSPFPSPKSANGAVGLHYLKFGYFFTDLQHGNGGSLQVVRGSHLRSELDGKGGPDTGKGMDDDGVGGPGLFDPREYDVVKLDVKAGTIVVFHQAQWHAAMPNESAVERLNAYISYCPTWMRPVDREFPSAASLDERGLSRGRWGGTTTRPGNTVCDVSTSCSAGAGPAAATISTMCRCYVVTVRQPMQSALGCS